MNYPYVAGQTLIPGDPDATARIAGDMHRVARRVADEAARLRSGNLDGIWSGPAADAYLEARSKMPPLLDRIYDRFEGVASILDGFAVQQRSLIDRAASLEAEFRTALDNVQRANRRLQDAKCAPKDPAVELTGFTRAPEEVVARRALNDAEAVVDDIERRKRELQQEWDDLAGETGTRIRDVRDDLDDDDSLFGSAGRAFSGVVGVVGDICLDPLLEALDVITEAIVNIPGIDGLAVWLENIVMVLDILALVPGLGQLILPIALGLSATLLIIHFSQAYQGEGSWGEVFMDVVSVAGNGLTMAAQARHLKAAKNLKNGTENIARFTQGSKSVRKYKVMKPLVGEKVTSAAELAAARGRRVEKLAGETAKFRRSVNPKRWWSAGKELVEQRGQNWQRFLDDIREPFHAVKELDQWATRVEALNSAQLARFGDVTHLTKDAVKYTKILYRGAAATNTASTLDSGRKALLFGYHKLTGE